MKCSDGTAFIACPAPGSPLAQDGSYPGQFGYSLLSPEMILDQVTGLVWQRNPPDGTTSWDMANLACGKVSLGTLTSGWRLPTRLELISITDFGHVPAQDPLFPILSMADGFWASSTFAGKAGGHWFHDLHAGDNDHDVDTGAHSYRCVHGALPAGPTSASGLSFVDPRTGLEWQTAFTDSQSWTTALGDCEQSSVASHVDWRLPNIKELSTLVDDGFVMPAASPTLFPTLPQTVVLFSSTPDSTDPTKIWSVNYDEGRTTSGIDASELYGHRCVRSTP